jgi:drug/metabolite transporter (DMT)-like permease
MFIFEEPKLPSIYDARLTILYTGVMSCGVAYTLQILGQQRTEPAQATMLMSLESVFAALSGWVILHEELSPRELLGCALVFVSVLAAQLLTTNVVSDTNE